MEREFTQPELVGAILIWLDDHGMKSMVPRQLNAVIAAADGIIAAIDGPPRASAAGTGLRAWLNTDDTGQSSLYVAQSLAPLAGLGAPVLGVRCSDPWPHDASDFGRCVRLLEAVPELRAHIGALANPEHGPVWNGIAAEWDALESLYREESPSGKCPKLYQRLCELKRAA